MAFDFGNPEEVRKLLEPLPSSIDPFIKIRRKLLLWFNGARYIYFAAVLIVALGIATRVLARLQVPHLWSRTVVTPTALRISIAAMIIGFIADQFARTKAGHLTWLTVFDERCHLLIPEPPVGSVERVSRLVMMDPRLTEIINGEFETLYPKDRITEWHLLEILKRMSADEELVGLSGELPPEPEQAKAVAGAVAERVQHHALAAFLTVIMRQPEFGVLLNQFVGKTQFPFFGIWRFIEGRLPAPKSDSPKLSESAAVAGVATILIGVLTVSQAVELRTVSTVFREAITRIESYVDKQSRNQEAFARTSEVVYYPAPLSDQKTSPAPFIPSTPSPPNFSAVLNLPPSTDCRPAQAQPPPCTPIVTVEPAKPIITIVPPPPDQPDATGDKPAPGTKQESSNASPIPANEILVGFTPANESEWQPVNIDDTRRFCVRLVGLDEGKKNVKRRWPPQPITLELSVPAQVKDSNQSCASVAATADRVYAEPGQSLYNAKLKATVAVDVDTRRRWLHFGSEDTIVLHIRPEPTIMQPTSYGDCF